MTMEDCIRKRKESIADILVKELRLIINEENTGVSILSVDIQDVRIEDINLFNSIQSPSKEKLLKDEELDRIKREREISINKLNAELEISEKKKNNRLKEIEFNSLIERESHKNKCIAIQEEIEIEQQKLQHQELLIDIGHKKETRTKTGKSFK